MILIERKQRRTSEGMGGHTRQCEAPSCIRSARFIFRLLDTDTLLCRSCSKEWSEAYENALSGWAETA